MLLLTEYWVLLAIWNRCIVGSSFSYHFLLALICYLLACSALALLYWDNLAPTNFDIRKAEELPVTFLHIDSTDAQHTKSANITCTRWELSHYLVGADNWTFSKKLHLWEYNYYWETDTAFVWKADNSSTFAMLTHSLHRVFLLHHIRRKIYKESSFG